MSLSKDLFKLVSSLNRYEKAYCLRQFRQGEGKKDKLYTELFQAMAKQKEYDDDALKKRFAKGSHASQFSTAKKYLYELVLQTLARYHAKHSRYSIYFDELKAIEVLIARKMYPQAKKKITALRIKAGESGKPLMDLLLLDNQRRVRELVMPEFVEERGAILEEIEAEQGALGRVKERNQMWEQFAFFEYYFHKVGLRHSPEFKIFLEKLKQEQVLDEGGASDPEAIYFSLMTQVRYAYQYLDDTEMMVGKIYEIIQHLEKYQEHGNLEWQRSFSANVMYISSLSILRDYPASMEALVRTYKRKINFQGAPLASIKFINKVFFSSELRIYAGMGQFEVAIKRLAQLPAPLEDCISAFNPAMAVSTFPTVAWNFLGAGQFREALFWIQTTRNMTNPDRMFDYYNRMLLIELVVVYELEDYDLLEARLTSFQRLMKRRKAPNLYDGLVISFFGKVLKLQKGKEMRDLCQKFWKEMEELKQNPDPQTRLSMDYFYMDFWAEAKATGISFREVTQAHRKQAPPELLEEALKFGGSDF